MVRLGVAMPQLPMLNSKENAMAKHAETNCDCGSKAASPLALRWRCSVCGTSAIMKISTLAAVCDGERIRKVEPQGDGE